MCLGELDDLSTEDNQTDDDVNAADGRSNDEARKRRSRRKGFLKRLVKFLALLRLVRT